MYGVSPLDNKQVKEIKAIMRVPQLGNNSVELPNQLPKDDYSSKDLQPLKTQALELPHLSPTDVTTQEKIIRKIKKNYLFPGTLFNTPVYT
ncbi:hypothetical protein BDM02DRAFT_3189260 [Thelephora ganbajun]|uniref:Uncharacterized protein n=1 Tax=Thelephora ganbajun TaxID=370292 RepID=A0ACB6Z991_THEGA|nr:hypothetical protein BDM02DRAFT_3189260 [Thelephora ganbajun]